MATLGGFGYGFKWPWQQKPQEFIKRAADAPAVGVGGGGVAATVSKTIIKQSGSKLAPWLIGGGLAVAGAALLGGKGQEQKQSAEQDTTTSGKQKTTQEQLLRQYGAFEARLTAALSARQAAKQEAPQTAGIDYGGGQFEAGRDIIYSPISTTYQEGSIQGLSQDLLAGILQSQAAGQQATATPSQILTVTPSITQGQEATSMDMGLIALLAIGAAALFLGKGKK